MFCRIWSRNKKSLSLNRGKHVKLQIHFTEENDAIFPFFRWFLTCISPFFYYYPAMTKVLLSLFLILIAPSLLYSASQEDAQLIVDRSVLTLERFLRERKDEIFMDLLLRAKGVLILPEVLKGAFLVGVSGGSGIFLVRDEKSGSFSYPAFYTLGGLSFGFQAGGSTSEMILLFMTQRGVNAMLTSNLKLGVDVGVALGPVGAGLKAETANLSADVVCFYTSKGLFGGISLDGAVVKVRTDLNRAYYGKEVSPLDILIAGAAKNPGASRLIQILKEKASK